MKRVRTNAPLTQHYSHSLTDRAGFLIMKIEGRQLLWIMLDGDAHEIECENLSQILDILSQPDLIESFRKMWARDADPNESSDRSLDAFSLLWARVLADVEDKCGAWQEPAVPAVTERLKKQLLWAFDPDGVLNPSRFLTILKHEQVVLSREQLLQLVSELMRKPLFPNIKASLN